LKVEYKMILPVDGLSFLNMDNFLDLLDFLVSSHIYLYSAFYNTDCIKEASQ